MEHSQISLVQSPSAVAVLLPMLSSEEAAHVRVALIMALALVKKYSQVDNYTLIINWNRLETCVAGPNAQELLKMSKMLCSSVLCMLT
jgi:hypothetical protein